jgi:hypothetical protein
LTHLVALSKLTLTKDPESHDVFESAKGELGGRIHCGVHGSSPPPGVEVGDARRDFFESGAGHEESSERLS